MSFIDFVSLCLTLVLGSFGYKSIREEVAKKKWTDLPLLWQVLAVSGAACLHGLKSNQVDIIF